MKIYFYRHQGSGVLHEYPFAEPPTEKQLAVLRLLMRYRHGDVHPKTKQPWWDRIEERDVVAPEHELPAPNPPGAKTNIAAMGEFRVGGEGVVEVITKDDVGTLKIK